MLPFSLDLHLNISMIEISICFTTCTLLLVSDHHMLITWTLLTNSTLPYAHKQHDTNFIHRQTVITNTENLMHTFTRTQFSLLPLQKMQRVPRFLAFSNCGSSVSFNFLNIPSQSYFFFPWALSISNSWEASYLCKVLT